jgi:hypothetical protein
MTHATQAVVLRAALLRTGKIAEEHRCLRLLDGILMFSQP